MRPSKRQPDQLRSISFTQPSVSHAEGAVLATFGQTQVLCTASVVEGVPRFLRDSAQGWLTAEYGMLPRSTHTRMDREAARGKQTGRTQEIQRLIGRSLRQAIDLKRLGDWTLMIDCDVLNADGGTRTAAISGGYVALVQAIRHLQYQKKLKTDPLRQPVAAVSVGIYRDRVVLDLDYLEDSEADTDMNIIMTDGGRMIELQGTAEKAPFDTADLETMLAYARKGIEGIRAAQEACLS